MITPERVNQLENKIEELEEALETLKKTLAMYIKNQYKEDVIDSEVK